MMARARLLNRDLATAEKFWDCSADARTTYMIAMPFTDRDGFLPSSPRKMLGLFLGLSGWSMDHIEKIRDELTASRLWEPGPTGAVRVVRFHEYQSGIKPGTKRYAQETESKYVTEYPQSTPRVPPRIASQVSIGQLSVVEVVDGSDPQSTTGVKSTNGVNEDAAAADRSLRKHDAREARAKRLMDCWAAAHLRVNEKNPDAPALVRPPVGFSEAEKCALEAGDVVDLFRDNATLAKEMARLIVVFDEKKWGRTFKGVVRQLGQEFPGTAHPNPVIYTEEVAKRGKS